MPHGVVDRLQAVEVEEHHRHPASQGSAAVERLGDSPQKQRAVRQTGQFVVRGLPLQLGLQLLVLGDVAGDHRVVVDRRITAAYDVQRQRERAHESVGAAVAELARPRASRGVRQHFARHLVAHRVEERGGRLVVGVSRVGNAEQFGSTAVGKDESRSCIEDDDRVARGVERPK